MKYITLFVACFAFVLTSYAPKAEASVCAMVFKKAALKCAKDPKCQKAAVTLAVKFAKQVKLCKKYRRMIKACRKARKSERKECRKEKRSCKKKCKKGKKGKKCRKKCRKDKRRCQKASRKTKRECRNDARATNEFKVCKDGRKMTRRAGGRFALCAAKHFLPAAITCAASLSVGMP